MNCPGNLRAPANSIYKTPGLHNKRFGHGTAIFFGEIAQGTRTQNCMGVGTMWIGSPVPVFSDAVPKFSLLSLQINKIRMTSISLKDSKVTWSDESTKALTDLYNEKEPFICRQKMQRCYKTPHSYVKRDCAACTNNFAGVPNVTFRKISVRKTI